MWIKKKTEQQRVKDYDRHMLRSAFVSLFWGAITEQRKHAKFTLQELADRVGTNKSVVSRWFSKPHPNWRMDTIADIAGALDLELRIEAVDRTSGTVFTSSEIRTASTITQVTDPLRSTMVTTGSSAPLRFVAKKNGHFVPWTKEDELSAVA